MDDSDDSNDDSDNNPFDDTDPTTLDKFKNFIRPKKRIHEKPPEPKKETIRGGPKKVIPAFGYNTGFNKKESAKERARQALNPQPEPEVRKTATSSL